MKRKPSTSFQPRRNQPVKAKTAGSASVGSYNDDLKWAELFKLYKQTRISIQRNKQTATINFVHLQSFVHHELHAADTANSNDTEDIDRLFHSQPDRFMTLLKHAFGVDHISIYNYPHAIQLRLLKSSLISHFISIRGTVVRVGPLKPQATQLDFQCAICLASTYVGVPVSGDVSAQATGAYTVPDKCTTIGCRSKTFTLIYTSTSTTCIDTQRIKIQEQSAETNKYVNDESGRVPRTVEVELMRSLVDTVLAGDLVNICGIVRYSSVSSGTLLYYILPLLI
jgi:DNA replicative helicase MCM subunit Mcm2 (Cdc46/Mcm family)